MPQAKTKHLTKKKRVRTGLLLSYMVSHIPGQKYIMIILLRITK